ncbi:MAG: MarR family winged helix-turn-helix transcriptional regulator [Puniceicoccaceae bacterium]
MHEYEMVQSVFDEIRRLHNRLRWLGDNAHPNLGLSAVKRSLLLSLHREGAQRVPELAKERLVSRQIIQTQINDLISSGLVKSTPNPKNQRSSLIELTPKGNQVLRQMEDREQEILQESGLPMKPEELETVFLGLQRIRLHLEKLKLS